MASSPCSPARSSSSDDPPDGGGGRVGSIDRSKSQPSATMQETTCWKRISSTASYTAWMSYPTMSRIAPSVGVTAVVVSLGTADPTVPLVEVGGSVAASNAVPSVPEPLSFDGRRLQTERQQET